MNHLDLILLIILGGFTLFGFWFGLLHTLGSLLGTVLGAYLAGRFYAPAAEKILSFTGGSQNLVKVIVFFVLFFIINRLVGFVFWILEKIFKVFKILPFLGAINRLLGGFLGLFEGALAAGLTLFFISKFPFNTWLTAALLKSQIAAILIKISALLWPLLPAALKYVI